MKSKSGYSINICKIDFSYLPGIGNYIAEVIEIPGCVADGKTEKEALNNIEDAILSWIETSKEFGDPIPEPNKI